MTLVDGYEDLTSFLLETNPVSGAYAGWEVLRVGRNPVWRIQRGKQRLFVKIMRDSRYYRRERHGLEVSQQLARNHEWMAAPELVHTDETQGALITTSLPGTGVRKVLREAFRVDLNPFRRADRMDSALRGFAYVLRWLAQFHQMPVTCRELLFDHSHLRVRDRVLEKLRRGIEYGVLSVNDDVLTRFVELELAPRQPERLLCGDATIGNFLWDGTRIGRVDFEDLGFGAPGRDYSEIRQGLELLARKPWYWSVDRAIELLPRSSRLVEDTLYRLESVVDRHWPGRRTQPTTRMRALERSIQGLLATITASGKDLCGRK
jgi:aminoglycoside phosphotransferase (APT) family kinase protein